MINVRHKIWLPSEMEQPYQGFSEPRCFYVGAIISAAVTIGMAAYQASSQPTPPNLGASSAAMSNANAALLPFQRAITAAATGGTSYTFDPHSLPGDNMSSFLNSLRADGVSHTNPDGTITIDFTGMGQADTQAAIATATAANNLALAQRYDPQFIDAARAQLQQADPQGWAARARWGEQTKEFENLNPVNPISTELENQVTDQLQAGKGLDSFDQHTLDDAVAQSGSARGGTTPGADFSEPLTTGAAGERRRMAGIQHGISFAASGQTPEDEAYRHNQEAIALMSSFVHGQTPQSQFGSNRNAQTGPTPTGTPVPQSPMLQNTGGLATQGATTQFGQQVNQPNSWLQGISGIINAGNAIYANQH